MSGHIKITDVRGRGLTDQELTTIRAAGSDKDFVSYRTKPTRYIEVDFQVREIDKENLRKKIDEISGIVETKKEVPVRFKDELDRIYYCEYAGSLEDREYHYIGIHKGTMFFLRDPYKYSPEKTLPLPSDISVVENKGTAKADPIFELTAKKKTTFAMISNGDDDDSEYNLIGKPATVTEEVVDTRTLLFEEDGSTIDSWTSSGTSVDGGDVVGSFGTDDSGITVPNYGTGSRWHGPAAIKEITPVQDFEVKANLQMRTTDIKQTSRVEIYLFDENMKNLGKMGIVDNMTSQYTRKGEARYGPFVAHHQNYPISSSNYQYNWDYWFGMLRIRRIGNEFEFYITRIATNTNHVYSVKEIYRDINNELSGKLKYIQIHIGTHGTRAYSAKFFTVSAYELSQATVDQTPYILDVGDVVTFDHKDDDILVNGEPRNDLKNFGGSFFKLYKGFNTLIVSPEDSFDTQVTYKNKYL